MFFSAIVSLNFFLQQLIQRDILHKKVLRTSEHFFVRIVMVIEIERRDKYLILIFLLWTYYGFNIIYLSQQIENIRAKRPYINYQTSFCASRLHSSYNKSSNLVEIITNIIQDSPIDREMRNLFSPQKSPFLLDSFASFDLLPLP